ncbi:MULTISPECIES: hypothetical protein [unclassified Corynebacterium]|uniref:LGFP repeat-containing protein n=1 Tax=unclassified Corynebacterium TaxID=2624378 RepID=UPI0029CA05EC|nr:MULTISPECIES: hypothetical protein [unclassified Corynebacterium]WPF66895.1 hypothetical protein OLX12_04005 [Corynebacterium sp. 22KM0430]WPF69383.1 hypothetical protein OLW90_04000 [Corynebacterium sp. 21KM1197]
MNKTTMTVAATALLGFLGAGALSACTPTENVAGKASEVATSTTETTSSTTETSGVPEASEGEDLPAEVAREVDKAEEDGAEVLAVTTAEKQRYLVELSNGTSLVYSPETGVQEVRGKLAGIWMGEGGLNAPVGLPVAAEETLPEDRGWAQDFERGRISWARDEEDQYQAEVQS